MKILGTLAHQLKVTPDVLAPNRSPLGPAMPVWKFGIGELIFLSFVPPLQGEAAQGKWAWKFGRAGELQEHAAIPGEALYVCPSTAQHVSLQYLVPRPPNARPGPPLYVSVEFDVIAPTFNMVNYENRHNASPQPNAGFMAAFILTPDSVSFARVALRECGGKNKWTATTDNAAFSAMGLLGKTHTSNYLEGWSWDYKKIVRPAGSFATYAPQKAMSRGKVCPDCEIIRKVTAVGTDRTKDVSGTIMFIDSVYNPVVVPFAWVAGSSDVLIEYYLDIPVHYTVLDKDDKDPGKEIGTLLATNRHTLKLLKNGTVTVSKGGCSNTESLPAAPAAVAAPAAAVAPAVPAAAPVAAAPAAAPVAVP